MGLYLPSGPGFFYGIASAEIPTTTRYYFIMNKTNSLRNPVSGNNVYYNG